MVGGESERELRKVAQRGGMIHSYFSMCISQLCSGQVVQCYSAITNRCFYYHGKDENYLTNYTVVKFFNVIQQSQTTASTTMKTISPITQWSSCSMLFSNHKPLRLLLLPWKRRKLSHQLCSGQIVQCYSVITNHSGCFYYHGKDENYARHK